MIKPTKRKAFNFLRSYFDVLNELENDSDKLNFLLSVINKQFLNEDPKGLNFIVNLCYESQRHQIEQSVKGWERASKDTLRTTPPTPLGTTPPTPKQEEEEEEKEKEQYVRLDYVKLLSFINLKTGRKFKTINDNVRKKFKARLKDGYTKEDIQNAIVNACNASYHIENGKQYLTPEFFSRSDTLDKYGSNTSQSNIINFSETVN